MAKKNAAPTMKDVAQEAGVALGTVSKVVNGIPVGPAYQKKVEAAIKKLDYRVNSYAKGLKSNKTMTIAFLVPDTINPFFGRLTYHINCTLAKRGYRMLLCCTNADPQLEQTYVDMAYQNKVDGIIMLSYSQKLQVSEGTPLVTIDRHLDPAIPCVSSDNFGGGQLAVRRLLAGGCKKLAYMSTSSPFANEVNKRGDGFLSSCTEAGIPYEMLRVYDGTPFQVFTDFLDQHTQDGKLVFDGIFCVTDDLALKIIAYLRSQGIRVPEDVQLIGYDGVVDFYTKECVCSTIVQPIDKIAEASVELILTEDWTKAPPLLSLPVTYADGGTTASASPSF